MLHATDPMKMRACINSIQTQVTDVVVQAEAWLSSLSDSDDMKASFSIVLAESLNNIVEHAYEYREDGDIDIRLSFQASGVQIDLKDNGVQMPGLPVKREMNGHTKSLEELPEGGFGWFLIHSLVSEMHYEYVDNSNCLTLLITG